MMITLEDIRGYVTARSNDLGFPSDQVRGPGRDRELVAARAVIATELRLAPWELSLPAIGRALGNRDHSTIWVLLRGGKGKEAVRRQNATARGKRAANGWCLACCRAVVAPYRSCEVCRYRANKRYFDNRRKANEDKREIHFRGREDHEGEGTAPSVLPESVRAGG